MGEEVRAIYVRRALNPFEGRGMRRGDRVIRVVSASDLKDYTPEQIKAMARRATPRGYRFIELE